MRRPKPASEEERKRLIADLIESFRLAGEKVGDPEQAAFGLGPGAIAKKDVHKILAKALKHRLESSGMFVSELKRHATGMRKLRRAIPREFWREAVDELHLQPGLGSRGEWSPAQKMIRLEPELYGPGTMTHETGHALSSYLSSESEPGSALRDLMSERMSLSRRMYALRKRLLKLPGGSRLGHTAWKTNPEEFFAQAFERAINEGKSFREAAKISAEGMRRNWPKFESAHTKMKGALEATRRRGKTLEQLAEAEKETAGLSRLLRSWGPGLVRRRAMVDRILEAMKKQGATPAELTEHGDLLRFLSEKRLRRLSEKARKGG